MASTAGSSSFWSGLGTGLGSLAIDYGASKLIDTNGPQSELGMPGNAALRYGYAGAYGVPYNGSTYGQPATSGISTTEIVVLAVVGIVAFIVLKKFL